MTDLIIQSLSILTIVGQAAIVYLLLAPILHLRGVKWVTARAIPFAFIVALIAVAGSLTFSEIFHWEPCKLCWYQRIFMYPLAVLLALSLSKGGAGRQVADYILALAYPGALVAVWHYFIQRTDFATNQGWVTCSAAGQTPSCSDFFTLNFGYITIPLMALTAFVLIILLMHAAKRHA